MPKAVPRSLPWKAEAMRAREVANMMAPPTPWTARARFSISGRGQTADQRRQREDAEPDGEDHSRPNMSPITPAVRRKAASVSE